MTNYSVIFVYNHLWIYNCRTAGENEQENLCQYVQKKNATSKTQDIKDLNSLGFPVILMYSVEMQSVQELRCRMYLTNTLQYLGMIASTSNGQPCMRQQVDPSLVPDQISQHG